MQINWKTFPAAVIAGIAGTVVFDILGLILPPGEWDVPRALSMTLGTGLTVGALMHYGIGITLAIVFAGVYTLFPGPMWLRGALFATVQTILGVWLFMMPLMGMGRMGSESPMGAMMGIISLVRHWGFGIVIGLLYGNLAVRFGGATAEPHGTA